MEVLIGLTVPAALIGFVAFMMWLFWHDFEMYGSLGMTFFGIERLGDGTAKVVLNGKGAFRWEGDYRLTFENGGGKVKADWYGKPLLSEVRLRDLLFSADLETDLNKEFLIPRERALRQIGAVAKLLFESRPEITELEVTGPLKRYTGYHIWRRPTKKPVVRKKPWPKYEQSLALPTPPRERLPEPRPRRSVPKSPAQSALRQREESDLPPRSGIRVISPIFSSGKALCPSCNSELSETNKDGKRSFTCTSGHYTWTS
ncbi:MAG: hypothetical protein Q8P13_02370 [bacterium]|nr:hypothetical protein [bacterium]